MEENYKSVITLQEIADKIGLSKEYFCRQFKKSMGVSFSNFVNRIRMNHIYRELIHSDENIQNIIEEHGFHNPKLFYRMFKEIYG